MFLKRIQFWTDLGLTESGSWELIEALKNNMSLTSFYPSDPITAHALAQRDALKKATSGRIAPLLEFGLFNRDYCAPQREKVHKLAKILVELNKENGSYPSCDYIFDHRDKQSWISRPFGVFKLFQSLPSHGFRSNIFIKAKYGPDLTYSSFEDQQAYVAKEAFADRMNEDTQKYITDNYFYLLGVCKGPVALRAQTGCLTKETLKSIIGFLGPRSLWITDDKYRAIMGLPRVCDEHVKADSTNVVKSEQHIKAEPTENDGAMPSAQVLGSGLGCISENTDSTNVVKSEHFIP